MRMETRKIALMFIAFMLIILTSYLFFFSNNSIKEMAKEVITGRIIDIGSGSFSDMNFLNLFKNIVRGGIFYDSVIPIDSNESEYRLTNISYMRNLSSSDKDRLIIPSQLEYLGAFKLPQLTGTARWANGGFSLTFYPDGDSGSNDNFPGSLFGAAWAAPYVSEIAIPTPIITGISGMTRTTEIQPFQEITGGIYSDLRALYGVGRMGGLEYLQSTNKIYWNLYVYYNAEYYNFPSHGHSSINLGNPAPVGPYHIGPYDDELYDIQKTTNYMFTIPEEWANEHIGGKEIATGNGIYRPINQLASKGPSIYAFSADDSIQPNDSIDTEILMLYTNTHRYPNMSDCDSWEGAAWITSGDKSAVIFAGRKSLGEDYYGDPRPQDCGGGKGFHCSPYETQFVFYDTDDFAAVVNGSKEYYEPVPYAIARPRSLFPTESCTGHVGGMAYDRENGYIYLFEDNYDADRWWEIEAPMIHVFSIEDNYVNDSAIEGEDSCGNGFIDNGEGCDGLNISLSCLDYGYNSGSLSCNQDCEIESSGCFNETIESSGGGGSGSGGSSIVLEELSGDQSYKISREVISEGYEGVFRERDTIGIVLEKKYNNENIGGNEQLDPNYLSNRLVNHTVTLENVRKNSINVIIRSDPINLSINVGDELKINLTSLEYYDLYIKLNSIKNGNVNLTIKEIREAIYENDIDVQDIDGFTDESNTEVERDGFKILILFVIFIGSGIAVILIVIFILMIKKKKRRTLINKLVPKNQFNENNIFNNSFNDDGFS